MTIQILNGDCLEVLKTIPEKSVNTCVTSPPYYGLRDYGVDGQIGLEQTPDEYVCKLVDVFREVRRVLRDDGTAWLNLGDSYAASGASGLHIKGNTSTLVGSANLSHYKGKKTVPHGLKPKDLIGIPWRVAFALQADGYYLRSDIIWHKPNPMPESVTDRPTKAHEYIFLLSKQAKYYYDADAVREPAKEESKARYEYAFGGDKSKHLLASGQVHTRPIGDRTFTGYRNRRTVWTVTNKPFRGSHFATFPPDLIEPCILAGCPPGGTVLDPFGGAGTTALVAEKHGRNSILIELSPAYVEMAHQRIATVQPVLMVEK